MENSSKKIGIKFGSNLAIYYLAYNCVLFFNDPRLFTQPMYGVISMIVVLALGVGCVYTAKKHHGGFITLKQAFTPYLIMISMGFLVNNLVLFVLFNYVKPEFIEINSRLLYELAKQHLMASGITGEDLNTQLEAIKNTEHYSFQTIFYSIAQSVLFGSIAGFLISLIFRNASENGGFKQPTE